MSEIKILEKDAPILREKAESVPVNYIMSKKIQNVIKNMREAMHAEEDGVAIAAPQIGESLRIFVVSNKAIALSKRGQRVDENTELEDLVFINPEIIKISKKKAKIEEGCLSIRWLYGQVTRSEKVAIRAYNEHGKRVERGASGLMAQIFQHEIDHLDGILFIDKAENVQNIPPAAKPTIVFFGSSTFSQYVLEELEAMSFSPILKVTSAKEPLAEKVLEKLETDLFIVASFGKILPKKILDLPKHGALNVHPSLLPRLRGPSPIQNTILSSRESPGVTIIKMDEKMDHGPILVQARVELDPWPDHYKLTEEKLGRAGGRILGTILTDWIRGQIPERAQDENEVTYTKLVKKEDGLLDLNAPAEENLRKVLAYSTWPGAYMFYKNKRDLEVRVVVKDAKIEDGKFSPTRVIPAGKREMGWQDFLRGNAR